MRLWYTGCRYCGTEVRGNNKVTRVCSRCQKDPSRRLRRSNIGKAIAPLTTSIFSSGDRIKCPKCKRETSKRLMGNSSCIMCELDEKAEVLKARLIERPEEIAEQKKFCPQCFEMKPKSEFFLSDYCLDCELLGE